MDDTLIEIHDTTLRDGLQSRGVHLMLKDKLEVIEILDSFGVDIIEAGWNGANPMDTELFSMAGKITLQKSKLSAFCSTLHHGKRLKDDQVFMRGIAVDVPVITLFGKTWDFQVTTGMGFSLERNLEVISQSIMHCRNRFDYVVFDAEHFFDGFKANENYAILAVETAIMAGANCITLCDTNGGALFNDVIRAFSLLTKLFPQTRFGMHGHNDTGLAVANSIAAILHGGVQIQGTINGIGERCGNANLSTIIPNILLKTGYRIRHIDRHSLNGLMDIASKIATIIKRPIQSFDPYVGENAFSHKGGTHIASIQKSHGCYEHIDPAIVGNARRIVLSDQSGRAALRSRLTDLGYKNVADSQIVALLAEIKSRSNQGYHFDDAESSLDLLIHLFMNPGRERVGINDFKISQVTGLDDTSGYHVEFSTTIGDKTYFRHGFSNEPVGLFHNSFLNVIREHLGEISQLNIDIGKADRNDAIGYRVLAKTSNGRNVESHVGVGRCSIEAKCMAIATCYHLAVFGVSIHVDI